MCVGTRNSSPTICARGVAAPTERRPLSPVSRHFVGLVGKMGGEGSMALASTDCAFVLVRNVSLLLSM